MGVLTSFYQVPPSILSRIKRRPELIDHLYYPEHQEVGGIEPSDVGLPDDWEPRRHGFDKQWDDLLEVYLQIGNRRLEKLCESAPTSIKGAEQYIRYWSLTKVKKLADKLEELSPERFLEKCQRAPSLKSYSGSPISEEQLSWLSEDHKSFSTFVRQVADAGELLMARSS